jgi:hypothetical protein
VEDRHELVRKTLILPEYIIPLNIIPVGYPTGEENPRTNGMRETLSGIDGKNKGLKKPCIQL